MSFRSDKRKQDTGAKCKVECVDETTTGDSTTEDYTTEDTTGPITTGEILTTLEPVETTGLRLNISFCFFLVFFNFLSYAVFGSQ